MSFDETSFDETSFDETSFDETSFDETLFAEPSFDKRTWYQPITYKLGLCMQYNAPGTKCPSRKKINALVSVTILLMVRFNQGGQIGRIFDCLFWAVVFENYKRRPYFLCAHFHGNCNALILTKSGLV
jgi:hypothetical protein